MANVVRDQGVQPDIDYHLDYQFDAWNSVQDHAMQWPTMDAIDKEVFHLEWVGITESRLQELQRWFHRGYLTPGQEARYQELLRLVAQNRPTLARLLRADE